MKINILTDNCAGGKFLAEHGLSYLIEIDNKKILFDTGHSNVFIENATRLGIDIQNEVEKVVLSHGHWDHGNGLKYLKNKTLITHPDAFMKRYRKPDFSCIGLDLEKTELEKCFRVRESRQPLQLTQYLWYLGEIPRNNDFEAQKTGFLNENKNEDFVPDDSALAAITGNSLVIISGCAHSGICNICEHAIYITGINTIKAVIGGFHLKKNNGQTQKTIDYFISKNVQTVYPSHCTELPALAAFHESLNCGSVKTGMVLEF